MKKLTLSTVALALCASPLLARTWTGADGSQAFEAEYKSYDAEAGTVTVLKGAKKISFSLDKLSEEDKEWVKAEAVRRIEEEAKENVPSIEEQLAEQEVGKKLNFTLILLQEQKIKF